MKHRRVVKKLIPLLIIIGLSLAGCVAGPPLYGSFDFDYGGWRHGWNHSHWDHGGWGHGGPAHGGFGEHGGFAGHGGDGHR